MFFTQEDFRKIEKWLLATSKKDTQLQAANTPLTGNETVSLVQNENNVRISMSDLTTQLFQLGVSDFLNITDKYGESNITIAQAIALIPFRSRKVGQIITFINEDGNWGIYQFQGTIAQWNITSLWINVIGSIVITDIHADEEDLTEVTQSGRVLIKNANKDYDADNFSGLGRIYLRKNITVLVDPITGLHTTINLLTQEMVSVDNIIYIIQYDYDLNGESITIPSNCVLKFEGGKIDNGGISIDNTVRLYNFNGNAGLIGDCQNYGSSANLIYVTPQNIGDTYFNTTIQKMIVWDGINWVDGDGEDYDIRRVGSEEERPTPRHVGFQYFDTTLNKTIIWNGGDWIYEDAFQDVYDAVMSSETLLELVRKTTNPYQYTSYLPDSSPFTTATISSNTPTKIKLPTTIKHTNGFAVVDRGGTIGNSLQYQGTKAIRVKIFTNTGVQASANNSVFNIYIYKNDIKEEGVGTSEKLQTGNDIDNMMICGDVMIQPNDFLEIWISTNITSTFTFSRTTIMIYEY